MNKDILKSFGILSCLFAIVFTWILDFVSKYLPPMPSKIWVSLFLIFLIILISKSFYHKNSNKKYKANSKITRNKIKVLKSLSEKEKQYLKKFIDQTSPTISFRESTLRNGILYDLCSKDILYSPAASSTYSHPYTMKKWAWKYLNKNPELLNP